MNKKLTGIYAALFTPFDQDGKMMLEPLQRHVDFLIGQGISGFYVNGSTGESFLMRPEERKMALGLSSKLTQAALRSSATAARLARS